MIKFLSTMFVTVAILLGAMTAHADTLLINTVYQKPELQRPGRGISMDKVRATYGEPVTQHAAVGEPPITRWDYQDFSVYFEFDKVLHSVIIE